MKMFKPAKIFHANIVIPKNKTNKLVTELYEKGICQLKESEAELETLFTQEDSKRVYSVEQRLNFIVNSLEPYKPIIQPEKLFTSLFKPPKPKKYKIELRTEEEILKEIERHLDIIEPKVQKNLDRLNTLKETTEQNKFLISNLELMPDLNTNLFESSTNLKIFLGIDAVASFEKIRNQLRKIAVIAEKRLDKVRSLIAIFTLSEKINEVNKLLHETGFEIIEIPFQQKKPSELISKLRKGNDALEEEIRKIKKVLERLTNLYDKKLFILNEELMTVKEKVDALKNFKNTKAISVFEAWVPAKNLKKFKETVKTITKNHYIEIEEKEDAPTLYKNNRYFAPFEMITNLYSPPRYGRFDPTPFLAVTFSLFFGIMLTDFVYGIILAVFAYFIYKGMGKYNDSVKNFSIILVFFGVSSVLWGMVFGSYFGDFFSKIGIKVPYLINSMTDVITTLTIVIIIGTLHMGSGLVIGFIENMKHVSLKEALSKQGIWLLFVIGILIIIAGSMQIGLGIIGLSVIMQVFFNVQAGGPITGILSIFGFSGYIGDTFSYARLMALGVGTSGIALAVNFLTLLAKDMIPFIGIIFGIIIFVIGHVFNMAMNGLGAFIHSTRLHFLEYFQKFYDGGGRLYKPFQAQRKKTYIGG